METPLSTKIEAILFFRGDTVTVRKLAQYLEVHEEKIIEALKELALILSNRGIVLIQHNEEVMLGTSACLSPVIEKITKEELSRDLGKAGLETLAIILYKEKASKREIDYIRGVNSGFILRNLLIRGLINREEEKGGRGYIYSGTTELLAFMGVTNAEHMPEFESVKAELEQFLLTPKDSETETNAC